MTWLLLLTLIFLIGLILYWQLIIAEGAYLGAPLVTLLYDWTAERYNRIKEFEEASEDAFLGVPLANRLARQPQGLVLDVATGTGRIPLALLRQSTYQGTIIGVDRAAKMLQVAQRELAPHHDRVRLIQADAMALPFADNSFPVVSCLEAMEFFPKPEQGLAELIRVLQAASPGHPSQGWLLTSNRIGWEARLMPGKTWSKAALKSVLQKFPLRYVEIRPWEDIYDQVWAQKVVEG